MSTYRAWTLQVCHRGQAASLRPPAPSAQDLLLRHLRTQQEIDSVQGLRGHIDLSMHCALDPLFLVHEKKETRSASRLRSNAGARPSGPFAPCPCGSA
jgi:hypothetical protein